MVQQALAKPSHGHDGRVVQIIEGLNSALIGQDVFQIEDFHRRLYNEAEGRPYHTAVSGIEHALWDLVGKALNAPIYQLLGGRCRGEIRLYANINRATIDRTPEGFAQNAQKAVEEGFTAVKCAPFDDVSTRDISRGTLTLAIRTGIERIRRIRETIGPDIDLMVDCHSRFNPGLIVQTAKALDDPASLLARRSNSYDKSGGPFARQPIHLNANRNRRAITNQIRISAAFGKTGCRLYPARRKARRRYLGIEKDCSDG